MQPGNGFHPAIAAGFVLVGGLAAGLLMLAVGWCFDQVETLIPSIPAEYQTNPAFRPWPGWTKSYMAAHPLGFGFLFTAVFVVLGWSQPEQSWVVEARRGGMFGALIFLVGSLPIFLLIFASFRVSPTLVAVSWALRNAMQYTAAGMGLGVIAKLFPISRKEREKVSSP